MALNRSRELKVLDIRSYKTMSALLHFINFLKIEDTCSNYDMPEKRTKRTHELSNDLSSSNFCWYYNVKECIRMKHSCSKNLFLYYVEKTC